MITFEKSIWIDRPIEDVFAYVTDPAYAVEYREGTIRSGIVGDGPKALGTRVNSVGKFLGREIETLSEVTVYDPPYQECLQTVDGPMSMGICQNFAEQDGGTLLTLVVEGETGGIFKMAEGIVAKQAQTSTEGDLGRIKAILEG